MLNQRSVGGAFVFVLHDTIPFLLLCAGIKLTVFQIPGSTMNMLYGHTFILLH